MDSKKKPSFSQRFSKIMSKALKSKSLWEDKDEFLDAVYWLRQFLGLFMGLLWGIVAFKGMIGILA